MYSYVKAEQYAVESIERLAKGKVNDRMLHATAVKIGIDEVVSSLVAMGGPIEHNYKSVQRYSLRVDDLRRCIHSLRSELLAKQHEVQRYTFA